MKKNKKIELGFLCCWHSFDESHFSTQYHIRKSTSGTQ